MRYESSLQEHPDMTIKLNDKQLRQDLLAELDFEPSIDSADIGVAVENGVVTLTGHVPSFAQKLAAERAAWRVKGVKAIAQELQVRIPSDKKDNDDEIAKRALSVLAWNSSVPAGSVHVKVQAGLVTLLGQVNWNYQRVAAESSVRKLSGVVGILNNIALAPEQTVQPTEVKRRIADALKRHAELEAGRIQVTVRDSGVVSLDGEVNNWDERDAAERAAWCVPGVRTVEDHLRIS
jgi:osmotically-inducible protein OsmY